MIWLIIPPICGVIAMIVILILCYAQYHTYKELKNEVNHLYKENDNIRAALDCNNTELHESQMQLEKTRVENLQLNERKQELVQDIADNLQQIEQLKNSYELAEDQYRRNYMNERKDWVEARQEEYLQMQEDFVKQFRDENRKKLDAAQQLEQTLTALREKVSAATALEKARATDENYEQFHSLQITEQDQYEIHKIKNAVIGISTVAQSAVAKVIWKVYYEKPYTDLIGRVCGSNILTGIYKITCIENKMCYVGQAVNIADRWKQHIKRAVGAEERTNNKLYPAMDKIGPWNFTFEVIEECPRELLNEREDYWQDFYDAKEYGYSIK